MTPSFPPLTRRGLIVLGAATAAGCTSHDDAATPVTTPTPSMPTQTSSPTPVAPSTPAAPQWPTREAIVAKHGKIVPREWGLETSGLVLKQPSKHVCLTFDACGGPYGSKIDSDLIAVLRKNKAKATLFLNRRWIEANPKLAAELAHDPLFDLQNHGTKHLPLSVNGRKGYAEQGTHNVGEVYDEVMGNVETLTKLTGRRPRFFRSGTAHVDEVAAKIVRELGMLPTNFSVNGDAGTTFTRSQIIQEMRPTKAGDIVIGHMNQPRNATSEGMAVAIPALIAKGVTFAHLRDVL